MTKRWLATLVGLVWAVVAWAQDPYPELGARLKEYFTALEGENTAVQSAECDYLIGSAQDSLVRQYVALTIYDHYFHSPVMGEEAVALHVARKWFLSGEVPMRSPEDLFAAQLWVTFNQSSLIGEPAPVLSLLDSTGGKVRVPAPEGYSVLYFYDVSCASCKVETPRLRRLVQEEAYPLSVFAIYVGASETEWAAYRASFPEVTHLWDPEISSDWQRLYGVLQTPRLFLVDPSGTIVGRGLDTPALRLLLEKAFEPSEYVYGQEENMAQYEALFSSYGDSLQVSDILDLADYMTLRTFGEGNVEAFKHVIGDLLYYISSQKTEVFREAATPFVEKYIEIDRVWTGENDKAQVVSLAALLKELTSRMSVGSLLPAYRVPGTLRRKPCLFARGSREGTYSLRALKGSPGYLVFYTAGCASCRETLAAVDALVQENRHARVLLIDMDALMLDQPQVAARLLDDFDLSALPMVIQCDREGRVLHRYLHL